MNFYFLEDKEKREANSFNIFITVSRFIESSSSSLSSSSSSFLFVQLFVFPFFLFLPFLLPFFLFCFDRHKRDLKSSFDRNQNGLAFGLYVEGWSNNDDYDDDDDAFGLDEPNEIKTVYSSDRFSIRKQLIT